MGPADSDGEAPIAISFGDAKVKSATATAQIQSFLREREAVKKEKNRAIDSRNKQQSLGRKRPQAEPDKEPAAKPKRRSAAAKSTKCFSPKHPSAAERAVSFLQEHLYRGRILRSRMEISRISKRNKFTAK